MAMLRLRIRRNLHVWIDSKMESMLGFCRALFIFTPLSVFVMRTVTLLKGWIGGLLCAATATLSLAQGVVLGPKLAVASEEDRGLNLLTELNCAACHKPGDDRQAANLGSRQSPILGKGGVALTPQFIRQFIEDPLRAKPGTTMPDLLHHSGEVDRKETVEALVHFLVSAQESSSEAGTAAEEYLLRQGQVLYHTIGCVACHEPQIAPETIPGIMPEDPKAESLDASLRVPASVPMGDLPRKTTVKELARFLLDPLASRPSGRMPSLNLTPAEATAISVYLLRAQAAGLTDPSRRSLVAGLQYRYYEENFGGAPNFDSMTPRSSGTVEGFDLSPKKRDQNFGFRFSGTLQVLKDGVYTFFVRSDDGSMLYIDGKTVVDNNGDHAPQEKRGNVQLSAGEHSIALTYYNNGAGFELGVAWRGPGFNRQPIPASALSHYGQPMVPLGQENFAVDRAKADKGRQLFASLGCASCHTVGGDTVTAASKAKPLQGVNVASGCLADDPAQGVPRFGLNDEQRSALRRTLSQPGLLPAEARPGERVHRTMAQLNCYACHTRDGKGGASNARLAYFRVVGEMDMGDEGRIPPHLTAVGAKLRPEWTHEVLVNAGRVRPYMATRMPQFGAENVADLPGAFEKVDGSPEEKHAPELTLRDAKFGRRLAGSGGLSCIACHPVGEHRALGISAINLAVMSKRLRYDWFLRYLVDPPWLRPGTRMPSFWPNGEAVNKDILGGNTEAQINALWAYLESKPETDLPPGLVQGRMELMAQTEPIVYRNFIQGAGPRAIAVGYPEKVNLAFDANNLRLALIWQGAFIDAARHWSGRGEGFEPPLGNNVVKFPDGPQFAILESENASWPSTSGKEEGYKMGGYRLNEKRQPSFFYTFNGTRIEERFEPVMGEVDAYFKRTLVLNGPAEKLWFRAAKGNIKAKGDSYILNDKILLKFAGSASILRGPENDRELLVPVQFTGGAAQIVEEIVW